PFYKARLAPLCRGADIDFAAWPEVPILTRAEVQRNFQALTAGAVPPYAGAVVSDESSGSAGRPVRYLENDLAGIASLGATDRTFRWWQFDGAKPMASFVARTRSDARPPDGKVEKGWRAGTSGPHYLIDLSADTDARLDWLCRRRPSYLTAHSFV